MNPGTLALEFLNTVAPEVYDWQVSGKGVNDAIADLQAIVQERDYLRERLTIIASHFCHGCNAGEYAQKALDQSARSEARTDTIARPQ